MACTIYDTFLCLLLAVFDFQTIDNSVINEDTDTDDDPPPA